MQWAPPQVQTIEPLRVSTQERLVASIQGCYLNNADVHLDASADLIGATVRLYGIADNIRSLLAVATVSSSNRVGLLTGARNVLARSFEVTIQAPTASADVGRLTLAGWAS